VEFVVSAKQIVTREKNLSRNYAGYSKYADRLQFAFTLRRTFIFISRNIGILRIFWKSRISLIQEEDWHYFKLSNNESPTSGHRNTTSTIPRVFACNETQLRYYVASVPHHVLACSENEKSGESSCRSLRTSYYVTPGVFMIRKVLNCIMK